MKSSVTSEGFEDDNLLVSQQIAFLKILLQAFPVATKKEEKKQLNPLKPFFSCALVGHYFSEWKDICSNLRVL